MKKILVLAMVAVVVLAGSLAAAQTAQPKVGDKLFDFTLPVPGERADRNYLGISGWGKTFKVADIKANLVLIEILSMYCPFCQKEAPVVNQLYEAIEKDPAAKGKIKIIGIGAGNSVYEVDVFRKRYNVPFPVFPDPEYDIHKKCGEVRTPFFIAVRLNANGTQDVTYARLGGFGEIPAFLGTLKKSAGL
ncbi:MAG: thiol-disulfide oxidoreductase [Syntrophaceae bacterium PtaB.Bin038]|nr:MAG: thiol-disulfide oxidoreductase [Syntrophaceae bacterium PtaB.Bin038]